jgi:predicted GNAT family acetyltransferase
MADIEVRHVADRHRYEAVLDGAVAGFTEYRLRGDLPVFTHTEVDDAFEGQGVGSALVGGALDDLRRQGRTIGRPTCEFVTSYLERHPEYQDLLG